MRGRIRYLLFVIPLLFLMFLVITAQAKLNYECPGDADGDGFSDDPNILCVHLASGDGFVRMADQRPVHLRIYRCNGNVG